MSIAYASRLAVAPPPEYLIRGIESPPVPADLYIHDVDEKFPGKFKPPPKESLRTGMLQLHFSDHPRHRAEEKKRLLQKVEEGEALQEVPGELICRCADVQMCKCAQACA